MRTQEIDFFIDYNKTRVNTFLEIWSNTHLQDYQLYASIRYSLLSQGKRIRALLFYALGSIFKIARGKLDVVAASIEMLHTFSLIHDDLPDMDNDDERRGQPSCHVKFGNATAILAGNALQNASFAVLNSDFLSADMIAKITSALSETNFKILEGQNLDLSQPEKPFSKQDFYDLHYLKTAALFELTAKIIIIIKGKTLRQEEKDALHSFAKNFGLAFQMQDDINDVTKDAKNPVAKNYAVTFGIEAATQELSIITKKAFDSILRQYWPTAACNNARALLVSGTTPTTNVIP
ncbi:MAG: hypothetical protein COC15_00475 [Legionellales bacterium]|nr:MAG: hypothetical protein COC15_00475 [Legionellales bacterium]